MLAKVPLAADYGLDGFCLFPASYPALVFVLKQCPVAVAPCARRQECYWFLWMQRKDHGEFQRSLFPPTLCEQRMENLGSDEGLLEPLTCGSADLRGSAGAPCQLLHVL